MTTIYLVQAEDDSESEDYCCWPVVYATTKQAAENAILVIQDKRKSLGQRKEANSKAQEIAMQEAIQVAKTELTALHGPCPKYNQGP